MSRSSEDNFCTTLKVCTDAYNSLLMTESCSVALLSNNQVLHQLSVIIKREVFPLPSSFT